MRTNQLWLLPKSHLLPREGMARRPHASQLPRGLLQPWRQHTPSWQTTRSRMARVTWNRESQLTLTLLRFHWMILPSLTSRQFVAFRQPKEQLFFSGWAFAPSETDFRQTHFSFTTNQILFLFFLHTAKCVQQNRPPKITVFILISERHLYFHNLLTFHKW